MVAYPQRQVRNLRFRYLLVTRSFQVRFGLWTVQPTRTVRGSSEHPRSFSPDTVSTLLKRQRNFQSRPVGGRCMVASLEAAYAVLSLSQLASRSSAQSINAPLRRCEDELTVSTRGRVGDASSAGSSASVSAAVLCVSLSLSLSFHTARDSTLARLCRALRRTVCETENSGAAKRETALVCIVSACDRKRNFFLSFESRSRVPGTRDRETPEFFYLRPSSKTIL